MTAAEAPHVVHSLPGRARVHVPGGSRSTMRVLERGLCELDGVRSARASARTRNLLVHFDREATDEGAIVSELDRLAREPAALAEPAPLGGTGGPTAGERTGKERLGPRPRTGRDGSPAKRARIAVRGLDRDPDLARQIVERLDPRPEVSRVSASPLTGRVLVELTHGTLEDIAAELGSLDVDEDDDVPSHPLDRGPTIQSSMRLVGGALGLGVLAIRRAFGGEGPPTTATGPAEIAATIGVVEGLPPAVEAIEGVLGHDGKDLLFGVVGLVSMTFSGSALGLTVGAVAGLRLFTEARAKRSAWREYENRVAAEPAAYPEAEVRLGAGDRSPLPGRVTEGFGTASRADGMVAPLSPGETVDAGARVFGGPFTVTLESPGAFQREADPPAPVRSVLERYTEGLGPFALAYAVLTGVLTRSPGRAFTALLLVSPRPAMAGADAADQSASARVLRAGVTSVGSRGRSVRRPDALLIDSPRVLTEGSSCAGPSLARTRSSRSRSRGSPPGSPPRRARRGALPSRSPGASRPPTAPSTARRPAPRSRERGGPSGRRAAPQGPAGGIASSTCSSCAARTPRSPSLGSRCVRASSARPPSSSRSAIGTA